SARTALAVARSAASPVSRRALARIFDSAAVRSSLAPSRSITSLRTFTPRELSAESSPIDRKSRDNDAAPRLRKSKVIDWPATPHPPSRLRDGVAAWPHGRNRRDRVPARVGAPRPRRARARPPLGQSRSRVLAARPARRAGLRGAPRRRRHRRRPPLGALAS